MEACKDGSPPMTAAADRCCSRPRRLRLQAEARSGMASNGIGLSGSRSALTFVDDSTDGSSLFGDIARLQLVGDVVGDSKAALACAGAAIARVEREVGHLWRDSMTGRRPCDVATARRGEPRAASRRPPAGARRRDQLDAVNPGRRSAWRCRLRLQLARSRSCGPTECAAARTRR